MPAINADSPLRRVRQRRGMTLTVLAGQSGLSVPFLSNVENGRRKLSRRDHIMSSRLSSPILQPGNAARSGLATTAA
jgi:hypothetical protein